MITACLPSVDILLNFKICIIPLGVQGMKFGLPSNNKPKLYGCNQSTSLFGFTECKIFLVLNFFGSGS